ncbi:9976_t:CDS:2 [Cetraspora pellucida]|uniref:5-formyltetrahydrofolate cyclo-ligase n=1 Tax=Cetraspora pellucida TaxID=1433469 RepID=A0A9N9I4J9_9GLOM|nr:9976_t:CDS:2 [Cetraspora pellucida]
MANVKKVKARLRELTLMDLDTISSEQIERESTAVVERVIFSEEYKSSKNISVYLSKTRGEISTESIIYDIFLKGKICYVPCWDEGKMEMVKLKSLEDYRSIGPNNLNELGFLKSNNQEREIGIAFDYEGNRLGNGKGSYDGYLARCQKWVKPPKTMALALNIQIFRDSTIPVSENDLRPDIILSELEVIGD